MRLNSYSKNANPNRALSKTELNRKDTRADSNGNLKLPSKTLRSKDMPLTKKNTPKSNKTDRRKSTTMHESDGGEDSVLDLKQFSEIKFHSEEEPDLSRELDCSHTQSSVQYSHQLLKEDLGSLEISKVSSNAEFKVQFSETREESNDLAHISVEPLKNRNGSITQLKKAFGYDDFGFTHEQHKDTSVKLSPNNKKQSPSSGAGHSFVKLQTLNSLSGPLPKLLINQDHQLRKTSEPYGVKMASFTSESERQVTKNGYQLSGVYSQSETSISNNPIQHSFDAFSTSVGFEVSGSKPNIYSNDRHHIHPDRILQDGRTTLYIRNIPNKYSKELMLSTIDQSFAGTYDFFYLPIDFHYGSNVGYAFINFREIKYIPAFYKAFQGRKWQHFNSEKICDLRYARIQGREQCESHFQDSLLMRQPIQTYKPFIQKNGAFKSSYSQKYFD